MIDPENQYQMYGIWCNHCKKLHTQFFYDKAEANEGISEELHLIHGKENLIITPILVNIGLEINAQGQQ